MVVLIRQALLVVLLTLSFTTNTYGSKVAFGFSASKHALSALTKSQQALTKKDILRFANLSKQANGTKLVGKELAKLRLSGEQLADTYARIIIAQGKVSREEMSVIFKNLRNTPGFSTTLRKISGNNKSAEAGHLFEIRVASKAVENDFKVLGIGKKFSDGIKSRPTDIDVLLERKGKVFAVELKNYKSVTQHYNVDALRADMNSLIAYKNSSDNVVPVLAIKEHSVSATKNRLIHKEADRRKVQLLYGSEEAIIHQIKMLSEIL